MPKLVTRAVGVVLVLIGIVLFILPIPVGWLVIGIGIAFSCGHDVRSLRKLIDHHRQDNRWLDGVCRFLSSICPDFVRRWLNRVSANSGS